VRPTRRQNCCIAGPAPSTLGVAYDCARTRRQIYPRSSPPPSRYDVCASPTFGALGPRHSCFARPGLGIVEACFMDGRIYVEVWISMQAITPDFEHGTRQEPGHCSHHGLQRGRHEKTGPILVYGLDGGVLRAYGIHPPGRADDRFCFASSFQFNRSFGGAQELVDLLDINKLFFTPLP
jgi:hypothetical protein